MADVGIGHYEENGLPHRFLHRQKCRCGHWFAMTWSGLRAVRLIASLPLSQPTRQFIDFVAQV